MIHIKKSIFVLLAAVSSVIVHGYGTRTVFAKYSISASGLQDKIFKNNTKKTLQLRWKISDGRDNFVAQEPIIKPKEEKMINLSIKDSSLQLGQKEYELEVSLARITKFPKKPGQLLQYSEVLGGIHLSKKNFLKHDEFEFYEDQKGHILIQPYSKKSPKLKVKSRS